MRTIQSRYALAVVLLSLAACQPDDPQPQEPVEPAQTAGTLEAESEAEPAAEEPLRRAVGRIFGLPLPEGLDLVQRDDDVAHFTTAHSTEQLRSFYERELRGFDVDARADGIKLTNSDESGADVYIVPGSEDANEVYYMRAAIDLAELLPPSEPEAETEEAVDDAELPFAERYPWPQGPIAPPEVIERITPPGPAEVSGGGEYYEERYEEIDGERVRVLSIRSEGPGDSSASAPTIAFPEHLHILPRTPGGSYDRGGGQRSLRSTPELGPDGRPLPFAGGRPSPAYDPDLPD